MSETSPALQGGSQGPADRRPWLAPALLVALAAGLVRFWRLGEWSLWIDEVYTLTDAYHGKNYNPLGYWAVRGVVELLGAPASELSLRLLPALCGWLAIPLTWWAFRPLAGDRRAALAALLVAVSPWEIYWSQNARFYTLVQIPGLVGAGLVFRGLLRGRRGTALVGLGVAGAGVLLQLSAAVLTGALVVAPALVALAGRVGGGRGCPPVGRAWGRVALALAIAGVLGLGAASPWLGSVFAGYRHVKPAEAAGSVMHLMTSTGFYLTPTLATAAAIGAVLAGARRDREGILVVAVVLVGLAGVAAAATLAQGSAQYALVFMPFLALLASWPLGAPDAADAPGAPGTLGTAGGGALPPAARWAYTLLLTLPLAAGSALYFTVRRGERPRWREAYEYVADRRAAADLVLGMQAPVGEFYLGGGTDLRNPRVVAWNDRQNAYAWARWAGTRRTLWLVVRPDFLQLWPDGPRRDFQGFLREECRLERRFDVHLEGRDLDLEVYRRP